MSSESAKVKLFYFAGRGRAEVLRQILAAGKIPYENVRFSFKDWPEYKKISPWGTFPLLEWNGFFRLGGTMAIARFVARKSGLLGKDDLEVGRADMIAEQFQEYMDKVMDIHMGVEGTENKKIAANKILDKFLPRFLERAENMLIENGGEFFVGKELTYADIIACEYLDGLINPSDPYINAECPMDVERRVKVLDDKPVLKEHIKRVQKIPEIKEWLEKRPKDAEEEF